MMENNEIRGKVAMKTRQQVIKQVAQGALGAVIFSSSPLTAVAKEKEALTPEEAKERFTAVQSAFDDEVYPALSKAIEASDWAEIKEITKGMDQSFRKGRMGPAKKALPTSEDKSQAQLLMNAITFDLIGINKAARKEDKQEALETLSVMKDEVRQFLLLQEKL